MEEKAVVLRKCLLSCQACVPSDWDDRRVTDFVNTENPCGTELGWAMRKQGDPNLAGCDERVNCRDREGFVHIMFDV